MNAEWGLVRGLGCIGRPAFVCVYATVSVLELDWGCGLMDLYAYMPAAVEFVSAQLQELLVL